MTLLTTLLAPDVLPLPPGPSGLNRAEIALGVSEARPEYPPAADGIAPLARREYFGRLVGQLLESRFEPGLLAFPRVRRHVGAEVHGGSGREQLAHPDREVDVDHAALAMPFLPPRVGELHVQGGERTQRKDARHKQPGIALQHHHVPQP